MTKKEYAEKLWKQGPWWCIKCDCSIEEASGAYLHPDYDEIVCEDCSHGDTISEEEYMKEKYGIKYSDPVLI